MNNSSSKDKQHFFPALTGLRAVAALLVYAHHALTGTFSNVPILQTVAREGHMGVTIFFVLSGFLIGLRYRSDFSAWNIISFRNYLVQRWARLYPVYMLCTVIALVFFKDFRPGSWIVNLLMLQGLFSEYSFSGVAVGWTLSAEVCFYLAAPLLLFHWKKLGLGGSVLVCFLAGAIVALAGANLLPGGGFIPDLSYFVRMTFFGRCFEFCLGIWLAHYYLASTAVQGSANFVSFKSWTIVGVVGIAFSIFLFSIVSKTPEILRPFLFHGLNNLLLPTFIAALLWGLCQEKTWLSQILGCRLSRELGKGSYIFYLVHYTFGFDVLFFHVWQSRLGVLLLLAILSVAGFYLVEAPLQKWIMGHWKKKHVNFAAHSRFMNS